MRAVIQRVRRGRVSVDGRLVAEIGAGAVILLGGGRGDSAEDGRRLAEKTRLLRPLGAAADGGEPGPPVPWFPAGLWLAAFASGVAAFAFSVHMTWQAIGPVTIVLE